MHPAMIACLIERPESPQPQKFTLFLSARPCDLMLLFADDPIALMINIAWTVRFRSVNDNPDLLRHDRRIERHMVSIAKHQLQRVRAGR